MHMCTNKVIFLLIQRMIMQTCSLCIYAIYVSKTYGNYAKDNDSTCLEAVDCMVLLNTGKVVAIILVKSCS